MSYPIVRIKPRRPERYGHPWIYDTEVAFVDENVQDGDIVSVLDHNAKSLGIGYFNSASKLRARLLNAPDSQKIDKLFWGQRFTAAAKYRQNLHVPLPPMHRLIHGEADDLPGLVVDRYGDWLIVQILTLGMDKHRDDILDALWESLSPRGIYERSDSPARRLEGLQSASGLVRGESAPNPLVIEDAGAKVLIDLEEGAKTGLFLDQRENQIAAARYATGRSVLNCFSYTGLFGLRAALNGAKSVIDVEISAAFNRVNSQQWAQNGPLKCRHELVTENAFDYLHEEEQSRSQFGLVILDPPAFTKSRAQRQGAFRGYNDINRRAVKLLEPGGVLVSCSCSHHIDSVEFRDIIKQAAKDAGRSLRLIEQRGQPVDHPVKLNVPESEYLKCLIFEAQ
jgi:23S rRNA (cytosine1962-C5)-methyltransferase